MAEGVRESGLSIWQWAELFGLSLWRVGGFGGSVPDCGGQGNCCDGTWFEYSYQKEQVARQDVVHAIQQAEDLFADKIGYFPSPHYIEGEQVDYPDGGDYPFHGRSGFPKTLLPKWGEIVAVGQQTCTLIDTVDVTYSNPLGLQAVISSEVTAALVNINDTFTATITVPAGTLPSELKVYFSEDERLDEAKEDWAIVPVKIAVVGTTATITGRAWMMGLPALKMKTTCDPLDASDPEHFATEIEVWRCVMDVCEQGDFIYRDADCSTTPCSDNRYSLCYAIKDSRQGRVAPTPAACNDDDEFRVLNNITEGRAPDAVTINYLSGIPLLTNGEMERKHARIIALLAASFLDCSVCACDCTKKRLQKYSDFPMGRIAEGDPGIQGNRYRIMVPNIGPSSVPDPEFGMKVGQVDAWNLARTLRIRMGDTLLATN